MQHGQYLSLAYGYTVRTILNIDKVKPHAIGIRHTTRHTNTIPVQCLIWKIRMQ